MTEERLKVAILIPTLNAGDGWKETLQMISNQRVVIDRKIIIDSGSTDETINDAIYFGFEVKKLDKGDFNHGKTRQQLVELAQNVDICIFLTQDAILATEYSLGNLLKAFIDPEVGMAYGRQLPRAEAKPLEIHARLFNYPPISNVLSFKDVEKLGFKTNFCSNSFAAYRRSSIQYVGGFSSDSIMGEDATISAKLILKGFKKAYVAEATVFHSHSYSIQQEFRRYFDTRVFHEQNIWLIENFGKPTGEGLKFIKSELKYVLENDFKSIFKSIGSIAAKWLGYNMGRFYKRLPTKLLKKVSMHSYFWK